MRNHHVASDSECVQHTFVLAPCAPLKLTSIAAEGIIEIGSMLDTISQIVIFVFGALSIILVGRKNRWGFVLALLAQPFWFYTAYKHRQWGILAANFVYAVSWLYGFYQWFIKKEK